MWNSWEWASIAQASAKTQRSDFKKSSEGDKRIDNFSSTSYDENNGTRSALGSIQVVLIEFKNDLNKGVSSFKGKPGKNDFGKKLKDYNK